MKTVGLTGGIATGKSTVARRLRDVHGVPVLDADQIARRVLEPGSPTLAALVAALGDDLLDERGALRRRLLRERMVRDPEVKATLDELTHPAIRSRLDQALAALARGGHPVAVVEAALLVETGGYRLYDAVLVVSCDPAVQVERLMARDGVSREEAELTLATQLPLAAKEAVATAVIRNDGSLSELEAAVDAAWAAVAG